MLTRLLGRYKIESSMWPWWRQTVWPWHWLYLPREWTDNLARWLSGKRWAERNGTVAIGVGDRPRLTWRPREESVSRRRECPAVLNASDRSNKWKTDLVNGFSDMKATWQAVLVTLIMKAWSLRLSQDWAWEVETGEAVLLRSFTKRRRGRWKSCEVLGRLLFKTGAILACFVCQWK